MNISCSLILLIVALHLVDFWESCLLVPGFLVVDEGWPGGWLFVEISHLIFWSIVVWRHVEGCFCFSEEGRCVILCSSKVELFNQIITMREVYAY